MAAMMDCTPEQAVIGVICHNPSLLGYAIGRLNPEDFQEPECSASFAEMRDVYIKRGRFTQGDVLSLPHHNWIAHCWDIVPTVSQGKRYVEDVRNASIRRRAAILGLEIASKDKTLDQLLEYSTMLSNLLTETSGDDRVQDMPTVMGRWLMEQNDPEDHSLKTGLGPVDRNCSIQPGQMVVVGGRPSAGKTALGLHRIGHDRPPAIPRLSGQARQQPQGNRDRCFAGEFLRRKEAATGQQRGTGRLRAD